MVHATDTGILTLSTEIKDLTFTVKGFISYLEQRHSIDLKIEKIKPLHVISCYGVSNGVYQSFSNVLQRPVIGYGDGNALKSNFQLQDHLDIRTSIIKSVKGDITKTNIKKIKTFNASVNRYTPSN